MTGEALRSPGRYLRRAIRPRGARSTAPASPPTPIFLIDIVASNGDDLERRLREQGIFPEEVILKYCWPRYAPPHDLGLRSLVKFENLGMQFERLIAMHAASPSSFPMPLGRVKSDDGQFAGYILEYVRGETLQTLITAGHGDEAARQLSIVRNIVAKLHRKGLPHGDINASNIIVADDGRTVLIDPVASPRPGTKLQDEICLGQIRQQIETGIREHVSPL